MENNNDTFKGNVLRATIVSQEYTRGGINDYTIRCRVRFYNPFIKSIQVATGVAKCHPEDTMSIKKGKHIAESRAKAKMYQIMQASVVDTLSQVQDKYFNLEQKELNHIHKLINE